MWFDGLLLSLTLAIALIGATTKASNSVTGKIIISALLIASTALTFWIKYRDSKRAGQLRASIERMSEASMPSESFIATVTKLFTKVRLEAGYRLAEKHTRKWRTDSVNVFFFLFDDEDEETIDRLQGLAAIDEHDLRRLARLDEPKLRAAIRDLITGKWGSDDLKTDAQAIASHVYLCVEAWLHQLGVDYETIRNSTDYDPDERLVACTVTLVFAQPGIGSPSLTVTADQIEALFPLPAVERGAVIARLADAWCADIEQSAQEDQAGR